MSRVQTANPFYACDLDGREFWPLLDVGFMLPRLTSFSELCASACLGADFFQWQLEPEFEGESSHQRERGGMDFGTRNRVCRGILRDVF